MKRKNLLLSLLMSFVLIAALCLPPQFFARAETPKDDAMIQVSLPASLDFFLDPYDLSGRGTLFSPEYSIINYSNVDIELELYDFAYSFSDNGSFLSCAEAPDREVKLYEKAVFMFVRQIVKPRIDESGNLAESSDAQIFDRSNEDFIITDTAEDSVLKIRLKAANYDEDGSFVSLNEDSVFLFTLMGDITNGHSAPWKTGDLELKMVYRWEAILPEKTDADDALLEELLVSEPGEPVPEAPEEGAEENTGDPDDTEAADNSPDESKSVSDNSLSTD